MATTDIKEACANAGVDPEDYNVDFSLNAYDGYAIGEHVRVVEDDEDGMAFEGDEGEIIAFTRTAPGLFNPQEKIEPLIWDVGREPFTTSADNLEPV